VKKVGDFLAAIIDANLYSKAKVYSGFFSSWDQITWECGIAAAGGHSRVRELERGILLVEADHPGWVQILQTRAPQILGAVRRRFPELDVRGISFVLSKPRSESPEEAPSGEIPSGEIPSGAQAPAEPEAKPVREGGPEEGRIKNQVENWEQIGDPELKDSLKRLERSLRDRERSARRRAGGKK
jgi:predicted DNA-binding transcriptional regulator